MAYHTIAQIKQANRDAGHHFFDDDTLQFFRSAIVDRVIGGCYFVTSEQFVALDGTKAPRKYTIRNAGADGHITTIGEFGAYMTERAALAEARALPPCE